MSWIWTGSVREFEGHNDPRDADYDEENYGVDDPDLWEDNCSIVVIHDGDLLAKSSTFSKVLT